MNERISIDLYMMILAKAASLRATCPRRVVGAVAVRDGEVLATGFNGAPSGHRHCAEVGCLLSSEVRPRCTRVIHAEANALLKANGPVDTLYCTDQPCFSCYKLALQRGVCQIYYDRLYADDERDEFIQSEPQNCTLHRISMEGVILEVEER